MPSAARTPKGCTGTPSGSVTDGASNQGIMGGQRTDGRSRHSRQPGRRASVTLGPVSSHPVSQQVDEILRLSQDETERQIAGYRLFVFAVAVGLSTALPLLGGTQSWIAPIYFSVCL